MHHFQTYYPSYRRPAIETHTASLSKNGVLRFPHLDYRNLGSPPFVRLLFDPDNLAIGIQATSREDPASLAVNSKHSKSAVRVAAEGFRRRFGLQGGGTERYPIVLEDETLVIELPKP